jgi:hypothetical protein
MSPIEPRYTDSKSSSGRGALLITTSIQSPNLAPDLLVDTYFARIHGKPYYILDESTTRQRLQANQLPGHLAYAIYAVSARYGLPTHDAAIIINVFTPGMHPTSEDTVLQYASDRNMPGALGWSLR